MDEYIYDSIKRDLEESMRRAQHAKLQIANLADALTNACSEFAFRKRCALEHARSLDRQNGDTTFQDQVFKSFPELRFSIGEVRQESDEAHAQ